MFQRRVCFGSRISCDTFNHDCQRFADVNLSWRFPNDYFFSCSFFPVTVDVIMASNQYSDVLTIFFSFSHSCQKDFSSLCSSWLTNENETQFAFSETDLRQSDSDVDKRPRQLLQLPFPYSLSFCGQYNFTDRPFCILYFHYFHSLNFLTRLHR